MTEYLSKDVIELSLVPLPFQKKILEKVQNPILLHLDVQESQFLLGWCNKNFGHYFVLVMLVRVVPYMLFWLTLNELQFNGLIVVLFAHSNFASTLLPMLELTVKIIQHL